MNKHDGTEIGTDEWKASTTASLLASSVCELSGCSLAAMNKVEVTLNDIFSHIDPLFLDVIYHYVNQAFTESNNE
jgi:hypothetical protein